MKDKKKIPEAVLEAMRQSDKPIHSDKESILEAASQNEEIKYKLMDLTHDRKVTMSNQLVFSSQPMSTLEARLLRIVLSQVESYEDEDLLDIENFVYTARVKDLIVKLGSPLSKNMYREIENAGRSLRQRGVFLQNKNGDWIEISWFSYVKYSNGKGEISLKLNPDIYVFLRNLKNNFSYYSLELLLTFKSKYSIRMYEAIYAKVHRDTRTRNAYNSGYDVTISFDIDEIKILTATLHKYEGRIGSFKRRVIEPAVKEISEFSELFITDYTSRAVASAAIDTFDFTLYNKKAKSTGKLTKSQEKLFLCDGLLRDDLPLTADYIQSVLTAFDLSAASGIAGLSALIAAYPSTREFNADFRKALPRAKSDVVRYMLKMAENRDPAVEEPVFKDEKHLLKDESRLTLTYIQTIFDAYAIDYAFDDLREIYWMYKENTRGFNTDFARAKATAPDNTLTALLQLARGREGDAQKSSSPAESFPGQPVAESEKWTSGKKNLEGGTLNEGADRQDFSISETEINEALNTAVEYWNAWADRIKMEVPEEYQDQVLMPKKNRRITENQKKYVAALLNRGETPASIKTAIDVAVHSSYFLRTQGGFSFFINPKNYDAIAAGERDYDSEQVKMWKMR